MIKRGLVTRKFNWSCATYLGTFLQMQQDPMTITSLSVTVFYRIIHLEVSYMWQVINVLSYLIK
jgi:hypothetical protein